MIWRIFFGLSWRPLVCALAMLLLASAHPALAQDTPQPWRLNHIPLDMPLEAELNGEFLEGIYQEVLATRLIDSVGIPWPGYHIHSTLHRADKSGEEKMELHFSSPADGQRIFWVRVSSGPLPAGSSADQMLPLLEQQFGIPDRLYTDPDGSGSVILLFVDDALPAEQRARIAGNLPLPPNFTAADFREFWEMDLAQRAHLLSMDYRGAIAVLNVWKGELKSLQTELLDLRGAATVYTLR